MPQYLRRGTQNRGYKETEKIDVGNLWLSSDDLNVTGNVLIEGSPQPQLLDVADVEIVFSREELAKLSAKDFVDILRQVFGEGKLKRNEFKEKFK